MTAIVITYQDSARRIMALAALACFAAVIAYGTFLLLAVEKAAARQQYQNQAQAISQSLDAMESQYLSLSNTLTPQKAADLGLVPVPASRIAYAAPETASFSMR